MPLEQSRCFLGAGSLAKPRTDFPGRYADLVRRSLGAEGLGTFLSTVRSNTIPQRRIQVRVEAYHAGPQEQVIRHCEERERPIATILDWSQPA